MAFKKTQEESVPQSRTRYDLDNPEDRKAVREFEAEISQYIPRSIEVFGNTIKGIDVYLHEKGLLRYSRKYPYGAVNGSRLQEFRDVQMKIAALRELWDRRDVAKEEGDFSDRNLENYNA